jgi:hypothetical protein
MIFVHLLENDNQLYNNARWIQREIQRYLPTVSNVHHLACSCTQVLVHCQHCAAQCLLRYTGTCPLSALCSTLLAQVHRDLPTVSTVQHLTCSGTQRLAHCQHCAAPCLLRYTGTCPLSALCSTLLAHVYRDLPTVSTVQHIACSGTQGLAHCKHCAAPCLLRYTGTFGSFCVKSLATKTHFIYGARTMDQRHGNSRQLTVIQALRGIRGLS